VPSGNQFKVFYKLDSRTPGSVASQGEVTWGTLYGTYTGGTTTNIEIDFLPITSYPYGKQHWFKILDTVTGSYIIENVYIHDYEYYTACLSTPTPTPTLTPTPTPTPTETPIPTNTPVPTATPIVTNTPTPTATPPPTDTPTPTPTTLCDAPTLSGVTLDSGSLFTFNYSAPTNCTALTLSSSRDQINWSNSTGGCTTGRQKDTGDASGTWYFRLTQICSVGTGNSNIVSYTYTTTPTPTPTSTPTPTVGSCYQYQYGPAQAGCTIYWNNCQGVQQSTFVSAGQYYNVGCAQSGTLSGCGAFTQGVSCDPTPTPTPTETQSLGQCYTYTVDYNVSTTAYGVNYTPVGGSATPVQFNSLVSDDNGLAYVFNICSTVEPTLLDCSSWPSTTGIGYASGISRTGPNGYCSNNFDCTSPLPTSTPTPTPPPGGTYGWDCDGLGNCSYVLNGYYSTQQDCLNNCSGGSGGGGGGY
jgi:hypothetical protein